MNPNLNTDRTALADHAQGFVQALATRGIEAEQIQIIRPGEYPTPHHLEQETLLFPISDGVLDRNRIHMCRRSESRDHDAVEATSTAASLGAFGRDLAGILIAHPNSSEATFLELARSRGIPRPDATAFLEQGVMTGFLSRQRGKRGFTYCWTYTKEAE